MLTKVSLEFHIKEDNHYKNLVNRIPIGTYLFVSSPDGSMRFDFVSPKFCQIYGIAEEDFLHDPSLAFSITHPEDSQSLIDANQHAMDSGESFHWQGRYVVNEKTIWVEISSEPSRLANGDILWSGIIQDITGRKKAEEALLKSSKEWAFAMDFFDDAIYLIDLDDKLVRANRTFYMMTGLTPEKAVGQDITSIIHPQGEEVPCPVCKARTERRDEVIIMEADHPDNPAGRPIQVTVQIVRDNNGEPLSVLMGIRDLSSTRAAEEERAKLQSQLHHSQKMDALGKLTGGIAHDFNNMLGVIMGYADLLEVSLDKQPELAKYAYEIYHAGERGHKLTRKLLTFSRQRVSEATSTNLNTLLSNQQHMLEKTLTVRIELALKLADNLWPAWINESEMEDIILNMSINAMHAIDGNGQLTISTSNQHLNPLEAQAIGISSGDYVLFSMKDTGHGMDEATKEKIFEPFFTTKGEHGTGLGLSQVYGFVHGSAGAIKVYSEPGKGSEFLLFFPRYIASKNNEQADNQDQVIDISGTETILIVDDESSLLSLNGKILARRGFNTLTADSAKKALEILEHEKVDLLLSDILMPEMDGYELSAIVKEKYPEIKIQLISGYTDDRNVSMVDGELEKNILFKPFNTNTLLQRVHELLH